MADLYLIGVLTQAIKNSTTDTFYNKDITKRIKMDEIRSTSGLVDYLGYDCWNDDSDVEIELESLVCDIYGLDDFEKKQILGSSN